MSSKNQNIMKKIGLLLIALAMINAYTNAQTIEKIKDKSAKISFTKTVHDYGNITLNSDGTSEFKFKNEGKAVLILSNVRSSCGCTVPNWPKGPIKKGEAGTIKVKYNTARAGSFSKSITVYSNGSQQPVILRIKGNVVSDNAG